MPGRSSGACCGKSVPTSRADRAARHRPTAERLLRELEGKSPAMALMTARRREGHPPWLRAALRAPMTPASLARVVRTLRRHVSAWRPTAVSEVAAEQPDSFRILVACLLSLRTQDTTTRPAAARLLRLADTPAAMRRLSPRAIERAIFPVGFYRTKARVIREVCTDLLARFAGRVPEDLDALLTLRGVGRKTANLVVTVGFRKPGICVDTHVHRISNRLGFVRTRTPEQTEFALRAKLPRRYWLDYNDLLVTFGQNVCRPLSPQCSRCPVEALCFKVGVGRAR